MSGFDIAICVCKLVKKKDVFTRVKPDSFLQAFDFHASKFKEDKRVPADDKKFIIHYPEETQKEPYSKLLNMITLVVGGYPQTTFDQQKKQYDQYFSEDAVIRAEEMA